MKWVSVKDRFPNEGDCVLVSVKDGGVWQAFYKPWIMSDEWELPNYNHDVFNWDDVEISHWMPLPPIPED